MRHFRPNKMILTGFVLVVLGWVLPFLMMLRVLESSFFLNFLSYAASITGLLLGVIGSAMGIVKRDR